MVCAMNNQDGLSVLSEVVRCFEVREEISEELLGEPVFVGLGYENAAGLSVPSTSPTLIGPCQAIRQECRIVTPGFHRTFEQAPPAERIVVHAETVNSALSREFTLAGTHVARRQVVLSELTGDMRLKVSVELRPCPSNVDPFSETFSPPFVILWNAVELRKVEGESSQLVSVLVQKCHHRGSTATVDMLHQVRKAGLVDASAMSNLPRGPVPLVKRPELPLRIYIDLNKTLAGSAPRLNTGTRLTSWHTRVLRNDPLYLSAESH